MTEIYIHIVARTADYMDTHPYNNITAHCSVDLPVLDRYAAACDRVSHLLQEHSQDHSGLWNTYIDRQTGNARK